MTQAALPSTAPTLASSYGGPTLVAASPSAPRVLVVDDDEGMRDMLSILLRKRGYQAHSAGGVEEAIERLGDEAFDVIVTDFEMPGATGLDLAKRVAEGSNIPVIVLTGKADLERAISSIRVGVFDFLRKPVSPDTITVALERALRHLHLSKEVVRLRQELELPGEIPEIIGRSRAIRHLTDLVMRVAPADVTALITGESGTGKELVARALHSHSDRSEEPFVAINCAAVPPHLLEAELFGHAKGAFTDGGEQREGLFVSARRGTIFLDEIGEMPMEMQAKLLRALQESSVRPVGSNEEVEIHARVVAATNRDLEEMVEEGTFREDLFYRVNVVHLPVPPLRKRGRDVILLARAFVQRAAQRSGRDLGGISDAAAKLLLAYDWPGNVRELENCIERGVALTRHEELTPEDLSDKIRNYAPVRTDDDALEAELPSMEELERRHILRVLQAVGGNKTRAAKVLGFDRRTLYRKAERYGMEI